MTTPGQSDLSAIASAHRPASFINDCENFGEIVRAGRFVSGTDGITYALASSGFRWRWSTKGLRQRRDPGRIIFEGDAAALFKRPCPLGILTSMKWALGQYVAPPGELHWTPVAPDPLDPTRVVVRQATVRPYADQRRFRWLRLRALQRTVFLGDFLCLALTIPFIPKAVIARLPHPIWKQMGGETIENWEIMAGTTGVGWLVVQSAIWLLGWINRR
ncbi:hypothetical protein [Azospirillum sp. B510]|uniref:hypothetical protein n=1 Tax=Azospirillum sp. (strain B510) TaxID=137722 RepID=UPI0005AA9161|nr:hypothetical protein [Azospirillum sp. B510]